MEGGSCWNGKGGGPLQRGSRGWASGIWKHWPEQGGEGVGSKEHGMARRGREFWNPRLVREEWADQPGHQAKLWVGLDGRHQGATDLSKELNSHLWHRKMGG